MPRYLTNLAGLSFRPAEAKACVRALEEGQEVELVREPTNAYDPNAIKILTRDENGEKQFIGYVEKLANAELAQDLDNAFRYDATVKTVYEDDGMGGKAPAWMRPLFEIVTVDGAA